MSERHARIVTGPDGAEVLQIAKGLLRDRDAEEAQRAEVSALKAEVAALRERVSDSPPNARIRLGMDAAAREQISALRSDMIRGQEEAAKVGAQIAEAIRALAAAVSGIAPVINLPAITPTFAPVFAPEVKAGEISVEARVQLPPPRARKGKQKNPDGSVTEFEISGG